jgi:two-component system sensor histidine kinase DegS
MVREIMSGMRPSSLDMGLHIALEELADEPEAQIGGKVNIHSDINTPAEPINYDKDVELHLYRMVQQACRNALEHAQANAIHIRGTLSEESIDLAVEDDGIGFEFEFDGLPDLGLLIINHHFGLANIVERARIIHADVTITSRPNKGTSIHFDWQSRDNHS